MDFLQVINGNAPLVENITTEIVERKGKGHPDSLCDIAAEELSIALSQFYLKNTEHILHHNVDKAVLVGGSSEVNFGGGRIITPIQLDIVGRATLQWDNVKIDPEEVFKDQVIERLCCQVRHLQPEHLVVNFRLRPGSQDLQTIFRDENQVPLANDTSLSVGFAPLSETEKLVLGVESFLNGEEGKRIFPQLGEDIKVMAVRNNDDIKLTIASAFIASETQDRATYDSVKQQLAKFIQTEFAPRHTNRRVQVFVNTADTKDSAYLTVTGTSAESGDDGQVGRGNRASGLVTPYRPMSLEAIAGKNPVSHVGKVYNIMTKIISDQIVKQIPEVKQVYCYIVSRIGQPINKPQIVSVELWGIDPSTVKEKVASIVGQVLENWKDIRNGFLERRWQIC